MSNCCTDQSVGRVCGDFETATNPDAGCCHTKARFISCEAPDLPGPECNDINAYIEYHPGEIPAFVVIGTLFDQNCEAILDEGSNPILTQIS